MRIKRILNDQHIRRLHILDGYLSQLVLGCFVMLITVVIQLYFPKATSYFIDNATSDKTLTWFLYFGGAMLILLAIQSLGTAYRYFIFESVGQKLVAKLRRTLFNAILKQPISYHDANNFGELTNRLSADVELIKDTLTMDLAIALRALLVTLGSLVALVLLSPMLSTLLLLFIPATFYLSNWIGKKIDSRSAEEQALKAKTNKVAVENLSNIRLINAFNQQVHASQSYRLATESTLSKSLECARYLSLFQGGTTFLASIALLCAVMMGGYLITTQALTVGELTSFILYAMMATSSIGGLSNFWANWKATTGATDHIFNIMESSPTNRKKETLIDEIKGNINFHNVSLCYPQRPGCFALMNTSFELKSGQKLGIIGASGSGKSSILSLILGHYLATDGKIIIDGKDLKEINLNAVRASIAVVEQEPTLFATSIFDNIAFGVSNEEVTPHAVYQAAKLANAHDFISALPDGYQTLAGDRGVQLSGGQKQRIAIARAIIRNPKILLLDEATSALDASTEHLVQEALNNLMRGRTCIIVAHRLKAIAHADVIIELKQGKIVRSGGPADFLTSTENINHKQDKQQLDSPTIVNCA